MTKIDELSQEIIKEYKTGNEQRRVLLQTLKAALLMKEKEKGKLTETDEVAVLKNELKVRQQARTDFEKGGRVDLVEKTDEEIAEIKKMLPEEMSEQEIEKVVREVISLSEDKAFGSIMKQSMSRLAGKADGGTVSQVVRRVLG